MTLDAAIIGGGPAGAAAAISLRQLMPRATIAIYDDGANDRWRPGEILAPGSASILESLGCGPHFRECGFHQSFGTRAVWGTQEPSSNDFLFGLRGYGWRLDRARFDAMLLERAQAAGAEVHRTTRLVGSAPDGVGWTLRFRGSESSARFVVDASGRSAVFAQQRGVRRLRDDQLAGVYVLFRSEDTCDTLIEAAEDGWWYSASVPGATTVAAFMSDTDLIRDSRLHLEGPWKEALARSTYTRERLREAPAKGPPAVFAAHSQRLSKMSGPAWVAAGDAAMVFDPISSQGILKALRSGKQASFVAADFLARGIDSHGKYEDLALAEYSEYCKAKSQYYGLERQRSAAVFWKRRL